MMMVSSKKYNPVAATESKEYAPRESWSTKYDPPAPASKVSESKVSESKVPGIANKSIRKGPRMR